MKFSIVNHRANISRLRFLWPILAALIIAGDGYLWIHWQTNVETHNGDEISLENADRWTPLCLSQPGRGSACHVVFSFRYDDPTGGGRFAILGLSSNYATITAPIKRFTSVSWRVDDHPFAETLSTQGDGAVLSHRRTVALIGQMLTGKQLTVRFVESGTGRAIERTFPLAGFAVAYERYRALQHGALQATASDL